MLAGCDGAAVAAPEMCTRRIAAGDAAALRTLASPPYFPEEWSRQGTMCGNRCEPRLSAFENAWYSTFLAAAAEPSLHAQTTGKDTGAIRQVRFTWLRSFDPPVTIRIVMERTGYRLIARELSGAGGYDPGTVARTVDRVLTRDERKTIDGVLAPALFQPHKADCSIALDGAQWIFEMAQGHAYAMGQRHSPGDGGFREAGLAMIALTGWDVGRVY